MSNTICLNDPINKNLETMENIIDSMQNFIQNRKNKNWKNDYFASKVEEIISSLSFEFKVLEDNNFRFDISYTLEGIETKASYPDETNETRLLLFNLLTYFNLTIYNGTHFPFNNNIKKLIRYLNYLYEIISGNNLFTIPL